MPRLEASHHTAQVQRVGNDENLERCRIEAHDLTKECSQKKFPPTVRCFVFVGWVVLVLFG